MWVNYEEALKLYYDTILFEWIKRGFRNNMSIYIISSNHLKFPPWLGEKKFHNSHRSNLLRKDYEFYSRYNWNISSDLEYFWPSKEEI
ncbi:hypothetical protein J2T59_002050 [Methanosalsum natronophilum]|nr:hypothetical protein [Methanosalsum natronophilum]